MEVRCKGVMLRNRLELVGALHGESALERTLEQLPAELASALRYRSIVATGWYPVAWLRELHDAAASATGLGPELARQLGYEGAIKNFTTIHRLLLSASSPSAVISRSPRVLRTYFDGGAIELLESTPGMNVSRWVDCFGFDRNIWESMLGGCEAALALSRAKDVRIRFRSGGGASSEAEVIAFWRV
jgi:hypothetical protein